MHARNTNRWAALTLVGAGLLALAGCGSDKYVATAQLTGANEAPNPVTTNGAGTATATLDGDTLTVTGGFNGLGSDLFEVSGSPAHVHRGATGTAGPVVFPLVITSTDKRNGTFTATKELSDDEQEEFKNGLYYVNVHTAANQTGEIRGQFVPLRQDD
ncbi:CHRD domain-containing protein [Archangium lipolyticum]|uniref:CHRD domain-containing protein n=1 Tax=Archangium lipolyticum TaxID=2970465 RepID=UPI00214A3A14|nr:CHRD domain-containing protein [Archangium lipolyticum]